MCVSRVKILKKKDAEGEKHGIKKNPKKAQLSKPNTFPNYSFTSNNTKGNTTSYRKPI